MHFHKKLGGAEGVRLANTFLGGKIAGQMLMGKLHLQNLRCCAKFPSKTSLIPFL